MRTWITAAAIGASVLAGSGASSALAQDAALPPSAADTDRDRVTTREEAATEADRRFADMDANYDGKIDRDERRAFRARHRAERRGDMPPPPAVAGEGRPHARNDDGRRHRGGKPEQREETRQQFRERALTMFDRADTNHDGRVDAREREAMRLLARARRAGGDDDRRGPPPPPVPAG